MNGFKKIVFVWMLLLISFTFKAQVSFSFDSILNKTALLKTVHANCKKYRLQIIYTQINRDSNGNPSFKDYEYLVDSSNYFYCASMVKLPCSILAFEKLKNLRIYSNTIMFTDSANTCQHSVKKDTTSINGYPSIAQYVKRMALVSDNEAYSRVYEFLGVDYIHNRLSEMGYKNCRIITRFDGGCKGTDNTTTNPVVFYDKKMKPFFSQHLTTASIIYDHPLKSVTVGNAYINSNNKKINTPKDFTAMNYMPLRDVHSMLKRLLFYSINTQPQGFDMMDVDRSFLIDQLTMYPRQSSHPTYGKSYYDSYKKYFMFGDSKKRITNDDIKITNIVGQSYGFMADCAYIQNKKDNVEFMLSAVIYANNNEVINDGKYEYNTIALPFLAELGRQIYNYEVTRNK